MPVDFSIKQVPDDIAERLRERARRHHRSLQGELRAVLESAASEPIQPASHLRERAPARGVGLEMASHRIIAPRSESALMVREDRDGRTLTVQDLFARVSSLGDGTPP
jgi:plasmid stability protein